LLQLRVERVPLLVAAQPVEAGPGDVRPVGQPFDGGGVGERVADEVTADDPRTEHAPGTRRKSQPTRVQTHEQLGRPRVGPPDLPSRAERLCLLYAL